VGILESEDLKKHNPQVAGSIIEFLEIRMQSDTTIAH
jgi:hypothetical protein